MVALAETNGDSRLLRELFMYRFNKGTGISGMTFGNLFMAALADVMGSQEKAIEETGKILRIKGRILPISSDKTDLVARYEDGHEVVGEHEIDEPKHDGRLRIIQLGTKPKARIDPHVTAAIREADCIILGPGDLYASIIADLVITGVPEAIGKTRGKVVYIVNLMTRHGQTYNYTALDHVKEIEKYLGKGVVDAVFVNSNMKFPKGVLAAYVKEHAKPVKDDLDGEQYRVIRADFLSATLYRKPVSDVLQRSLVRHDPAKLARAIMRYLK